MRVALYLRFSAEGREIQNVRLDLLNFLDTRGWGLAEEYSDPEISGVKGRRPGLDRLLADARKRRYDVILIWRLCDLACGVRHAAHVLDQLRVLGIRFVSLSDGIDTGGPFGEGISKMLAAFVKVEKDLLGGKIKEGLARARKTGQKLGRPAKELHLEKVVALRDSGMSIRAIAMATGFSKSRVGHLLNKRRTSTATIPIQNASINS